MFTGQPKDVHPQQYHDFVLLFLHFSDCSCVPLKDFVMSESMRKVDLLKAACCVAGADGETSEPERRMLQRLADDSGIGAASLAAMIECAETDERFLETQFRVAVAKPREALQLLFKMAIVDGRLRKEEAVMLKRLSKRLKVQSAQFDAWLKQSIDRAKKKPARNSK